MCTGREEGRKRELTLMRKWRGGPAPRPFPPAVMQKVMQKQRRHKPHMEALLGHQTCPSQAGRALWARVLNLVWPAGTTVLESDSWFLGDDAPCSYQHLLPRPGRGLRFRGRTSSSQCTRTCGRHHCLCSLRTGWSLPLWLEKGNRVNVTKGLLSSELYHLVSLPKGCQEFINYRLMLKILPKKLTVKGATCLWGHHTFRDSAMSASICVFFSDDEFF